MSGTEARAPGAVASSAGCGGAQAAVAVNNMGANGLNVEIKVRRKCAAVFRGFSRVLTAFGTRAQALLDNALSAAENAKAEEAAARNGSRLEREAARVLRERAQLLEKSARLESKALQSQWHQARQCTRCEAVGAAQSSRPLCLCSKLERCSCANSCCRRRRKPTTSPAKTWKLLTRLSPPRSSFWSCGSSS